MHTGDTRSRVLVRGARQLLTLQGPSGPRRGQAMSQLSVVQDGSVLIDQGVIVAVGSSRRVENLSIAKDASEINASGRVVMPGFVDASTHLITAPRTPSQRIDRSEMQALRLLRSTPARALHFQASKFMHFAARHGTTTMEAKSGPLADEQTQVKLLRVYSEVNTRPSHIVATYFAGAQVLDANDIGGLTPGEWHTRHLLPRIASRGLARAVEIEVGSASYEPEQVRAFIAEARALGLPPKLIHVSGDIQATLQLARDGHALALEGLEDCNATLARMIATLPLSVIYGPFTNGHAGTSVRVLIDEGVPVVLATCFHDELQPIFTMQMVVSTACRELGMSVAEAVTASTVNAAWALGESGRAGSLEFGKDGDLILLNISDYRDLAHYHGANLVHMTLRRGEIVFREGELHWPTA